MKTKSIYRSLIFSIITVILLSATCNSLYCYIKFSNKTNAVIVLDSLKIKNKGKVIYLNDTIPGNSVKYISIKEDKNLFIENRDSVFQLYHHFERGDSLLVLDIVLKHLQYGEGFKIKLKN